MEIYQQSHFSIKLFQLLKQYAPYQKVVLIYDFSLDYESLNEIEKTMSKNCIMTKFIYSPDFDYASLNSCLSDCTRLFIIACDACNALKIKSSICDETIPVIQIQTTSDLLGYFLDKNYQISQQKNEHLLFKKLDSVRDEQYAFLNSLASLCCLMTHAIVSKIEAYVACNSERSTKAQNNLEFLLQEICSLFQLFDTKLLNEKSVNIQQEYLNRADPEINFFEKKLCVEKSFDFIQTLEICMIKTLSSLCVMECFHQKNYQIADIYKLANHSQNLERFDNTKSLYELLFSTAHFQTLKEYYLTFGYDIQRTLNLMNKIKNYINIKKSIKNNEKNAKISLFLLKNMKKFEIANIQPNFFSIALLLNLYEKIND